MALTQLKTGAIADDAVTTDKLANAINTERTANTAKVSLGADSVTGAKIADDAVGAEHIEQLDADLSFADDANASFGAGGDLKIDHNGTNSYVRNTTGILHVGGSGGNLILEAAGDVRTVTWVGESMIEAKQNGAVELYYDNSKKLQTTTDGVQVSHSNDSGATTLKLENNSTANSTDPKVQIAVDLASGKDGGSIEFIRESNYQSSAAADSAIVISPTKNDTNQEAVRITQDWFRLHSNCSGIQFNSDTASANALNDYEEGTFTPTVTGNSGSLTLSNASGTYTKIGNVVYFSYYIQASSGSTGTFPKLGGLPFAMVDDSNKQSFITAKDKVGVSYSNSDYSNMYFRMDTNATTATGIAEKIDGGSHTGSVLDISGSGARLRGSGFYFV